MRKRFHQYSYWLIPTLLSLALGGLFSLVLFRHMPVMGDAAEYYSRSVRMIDKGAQWRFYYPPGTPLMLWPFLRLFGETVFAARAGIVVMIGLGTLFTALLGYEVSGSQRVALITGLLSALYPPTLMLSGLPASHQPALLCVTAIVFFWIKSLQTRKLIYFVAGGLTLGLGCLVRPGTLSLGVAFAVTGLWWFWHSHSRKDFCPNQKGERHTADGHPSTVKVKENKNGRLRLVLGAGICFLCFFAVIFPILRHNAVHGQGWTVSINNEHNFFKGNNPYTPNYKTSQFAQRDLDDLDLSPEARAYFRQYRGTMANRKRAFHAALDYIREKPGIFLLRTVNRARAFWGFDYYSSRQIQLWRGWGMLQLCLLVAVEGGGYSAVMLLAMLGATEKSWVVGRGSWDVENQEPRTEKGKHSAFNERCLEPGTRNPERKKALILLMFIVAYQIPYCLAFSAAIYHFPVMGLIFPFAAVGVDWLTRQRGKGFKELLGSISCRVYGAWAVLAVIQVEYAYFTLKYM